MTVFADLQNVEKVKEMYGVVVDFVVLVKPDQIPDFERRSTNLGTLNAVSNQLQQVFLMKVMPSFLIPCTDCDWLQVNVVIVIFAHRLMSEEK